MTQQRILCFGDSNTWGYSPTDGARYPQHVRWTGVLQQLLGADYCVIEEGLNGRTTDIDYAARPGRNGRTYLAPCLDSHAPLDFVIVNLGANDTKVEFARSAEAISNAMEGLIRLIRGEGLERPSPGVQIILVAPSAIHEGVGEYGAMFIGASKKIATLAQLYRALAQKYDLLFVDFSDAIVPSPLDGVHLSAAAHHTIATLLCDVIHGDHS